ncbi:hypothetical protein ABPG74_001449 [Tetrahymena malaccensis]
MKGKLLPPSIQRKDQFKQDNFQNLEIQAIRLEKANTQEKYAALQNKIITASIQNQNQNLKKSSSNLQEVRNSNTEINYEYTTQIHSKTPQSRDNKIVVKYSKMPSNYELYRQETPPALIPQLNQQKYHTNTNLAQQPAKPYFKKIQNHITQLANDEQTSKNQIYQSVNTTARSVNKQLQNNQHQSLKNLQTYNKKPSSSHKGSHNQLEFQQNFQLSFEENERVLNETNRKGELRVQNDENGFIIDGQKLLTKKQAPLSAKESFSLKKIPPSNSANRIQNSNSQTNGDSQTKLQTLTKQISHIGLSNKQLLPRINANDALTNPGNQLNRISNHVNIPLYKQNKLQEKSGIDQFIEQQQINQQNIQLQIQQNTLHQKQLNMQFQQLQNGQNQQQQNIQPQSQQNNQIQKEYYGQLQNLQKQNQAVSSTTGTNSSKNKIIIQNQKNNNEQLSPDSTIKSAHEYLPLQTNQVNISHEFQEKQVLDNIQQNDEKVNLDSQSDQINTIQQNIQQNEGVLQKKYQIQININQVNNLQESVKNQQLEIGQNKSQQKKLNTSSENVKQQNQIQANKLQNSLKSEYLEINQKEQQLNQQRQNKRKDSDQIGNSSGQRSLTSTKQKFSDLPIQISYQNQQEPQKIYQQDDPANQNKQNKKGLNFELKQNEKLSPSLNLNPQIKININNTQPNQFNQKNIKKFSSKTKIPTANEIKEQKPKTKQEPLTIQQFELNEEFFRESFDGYNFDAEESLSGTWTGYTIQQYMKNQKQETELQNRKESAQKQKKKKNSIINVKQNENCGLEQNNNTEEKIGLKNQSEKQIKSNSDQQITNSQNQFIIEDIKISEN